MAGKLLVMLCCSPGPAKKGRIDETLGEDNLAAYQGCDYNPRLGADAATLEMGCRGEAAVEGKAVCIELVYVVSHSYKVHHELGSMGSTPGVLTASLQRLRWKRKCVLTKQWMLMAYDQELAVENLAGPSGTTYEPPLGD